MFESERDIAKDLIEKCLERELAEGYCVQQGICLWAKADEGLKFRPGLLAQYFNATEQHPPYTILSCDLKSDPTLLTLVAERPATPEEMSWLARNDFIRKMPPVLLEAQECPWEDTLDLTNPIPNGDPRKRSGDDTVITTPDKFPDLPTTWARNSRGQISFQVSCPPFIKTSESNDVDDIIYVLITRREKIRLGLVPRA